MRWVVEHTVFSNQANELLQTIKHLGHTVTIWDDNMLHRNSPPWAKNEPTVFYGALGTAAALKSVEWSPKVFCDIQKLHCSSYYPRYKKYLLNQRYRILPAADLVRNKREIFDLFDSPNSVFVRPDSPLKEFAGRILSYEQLTLENLDHGFYYDDKHLPVLVVPTVEVGDEWRFVISQSKIISCSGYQPTDRSAIKNMPKDNVVEFCQTILQTVTGPEELYVLDIVETQEGPKVLELNSFSCSDLYGADTTSIVNAVDEIISQ